MSRPLAPRNIPRVVQALRDERDRQALSMTVVAERSGLSQTTISLIERELKNSTLDTLLRISEVLEVELGEVILRASRDSGAATQASQIRERKARTKRPGE